MLLALRGVTDRWRVIATALVGVLAAAHTAHAATYYVAPHGNDAHAGSEAAPWRTLQRAANVVSAGDTVRVLDGDYQGFDVRRSGTPGNPITFLAAGSTVRITADNPRTPDGINVENAAHVVIDGFIVDHRTRAGVRAALAQFITIRNCRLGWNGRWGILTGFVDDLLVEHNEAHHSIDEHGIYASNSGDRPVIRDNWVHDNRANGIHINADRHQGGDGTISQALVEGNVIHGNGVGGGSGINMDGVVDSVVRNNLLFDNHASGISLYRIDGATGATNNLLVNNTIIQASDARWAINIRDGSTGARLFNNILYTTHAFRGVISVDAASRPGLQSDYNSVRARFSTDGGNSVIDLTAWRALGYDLHSIVATPADHFVAPGSDFRLLASSPAIDAGTTSGAPPADIVGVARPQGDGIDLGAYEYAGSGPSPTPTATAAPATATRTRTATRTATATASPTRTPSAAPTATRTATATAPPAGGRTLRGAVRYYRGNHPVAQATIALDGTGSRSATTDGSGAWSADDVAPGTWHIEPRRTGGAAGGISALDASYVLQHIAGLRTLDADEVLACDATANGALSTLDAVRILELVVGLDAQLPAAVACGSDWLFLPTAGGTRPVFDGGSCQPGARTVTVAETDHDDLDFRAIALGDCTGSWQPAGGAALQRAPRAATRLRALPARGGRPARLALIVRAAAPFTALTAELSLAAPVRVDRVRPLGRAGRRGHLVFNQPTPDRLTVAYASARPVAGRLILLLELDGTARPGVAVEQLRLE